MRRYLCAVLVLFLFSVPHALADDEARLLRFPAIHGDQIVFTYAGNLYTVAGHYGPHNGNCKESGGGDATAGSVSYTTVTDSETSGSYDLTFAALMMVLNATTVS